MGNEQPNQKFNPNFNMAEYNQKMNQRRNQYNQHHISQLPGAYYSHKPSAQTMKCEQIIRGVYIFKTSIQIAINKGEINVSFEYHCLSQAILNLGIGVSKIDQHERTKETVNIVCMKQEQENLPPGERAKFVKTYKFDQKNVNQVYRCGIMMKISSMGEYSEYSLAYISNTKLWKVVVQNFSRNQELFGIEDIYGGGQQGQQCIICMTNKANTMVKPCNHLCLCGECSKDLQIRTTTCPICRKNMTSLVKLTKDQ